jgi:phage terminase large subunit-like protein
MKRAVGELERLAYERQLRDLKHPPTYLDDDGVEHRYRFSWKTGNRVVRFFEHYLRFHKGEWANRPFKLQKWQKFIIRTAFGWLRQDGSRRFRTLFEEIARKNGKALALDTPIPTPAGWAQMGDLRVGDWVFDETGRMCTVTAAMQVQHDRPCFRVRFSDGTSIVADEAHEWFVESRKTGLPRTGLGPKSTWRERHIRTTRQLADSLHVSGAKVEWNHRVPLAGPLALPVADLPLDPYVLGLWLGDGTSAHGTITQGVQDFAPIRSAVEAAGYRTSDRSTQGTFGILGIHHILRGLCLLGRKHIPKIYQRASSGQRFALLQGLMDTDGYASAAGQCEFTTVSEVLRDDFLELARGLGFKPTLKTARATIGGRDVGEKYRLQFWSYGDRPVFRLRRKADRLRTAPASKTRAARRQIIGVEPVPSVPVRCIEVNSPSHLYLAGEGMIPTHNSEMAAGLALYMMAGDNEEGADVYSTATKKDQAKLVWNVAAKMVRKSPELARFVRVSTNSITCERISSSYQPLGADSKTQDGLNPHCNIVDELHAHKTRALWDVLDSGMGARRQPMTVAITTAGRYNPESIGYQQHEYARQVLKREVVDETFFAFITCPDETDLQGEAQFTDQALQKANPNWGVSAKLNYLRGQARKATLQRGFLPEYQAKHINVWSREAKRWLQMDRWALCEPAPLPGVDQRALAAARELALKGRPCSGGLDLSTKLDLTSLVLEFPGQGEEVTLVCRFWLPEAQVANNVERNLRHYESWQREGWLTVTPGEVVDYAFVRKEIKELAALYNIKEIGFDPHKATQLVTELREQDGIEMVDVRQGFLSLGSPSDDVEAKVVLKAVRHMNNPILRWCASNCIVSRDAAGNIKPDKATSQGKIDGIVAWVMARARNGVNVQRTSVYETRGFRQL